MPATSIKISPGLRKRVASAARKAGTTPHAFMVQAVERQTELAEQHQSFVADALEAEKDLLKRGVGYRSDEVHAYFRARLGNKKAPRLVAKAWRK